MNMISQNMFHLLVITGMHRKYSYSSHIESIVPGLREGVFSSCGYMKLEASLKLVYLSNERKLRPL